MNPFPFSIGLKLYSTNSHLIPSIRRLKDNHQFDFIELFVVPDSSHAHLPLWRSLRADFVIHAPHSVYGVNLAKEALWKKNHGIFQEVFAFSNELGSDLIVAHGGVYGSFNETLRQIAKLDDNRIVLENKPQIGIHARNVLGGRQKSLARQ